MIFLKREAKLGTYVSGRAVVLSRGPRVICIVGKQ